MILIYSINLESQYSTRCLEQKARSIYGNADHSTERVVRGDEADGPDGDTKGNISRPVDGYTDSATLLEKIREVQGGYLKLQEFRE